LSESVLQKHCHQRLPKHQVPGEFVFLKALPKSGSGKIDTQQCEELYKKFKTKN